MTNHQSDRNGHMIVLDEVFKKLGGKPILNGTTMQIDSGETRVIIGRSGEGKSVTIKHICGLMQPDQGTIYVDGEEIAGYDDRQLLPVREKIGFLFQNAALFDSLNVLHNVGFSLYESKKYSDAEIREQVLETLQLVRLGNILEKMPSELSGGMKKRVGLARAIIKKPKIILYDEPTTGLDPVTADAINELIISLSEQLHVTSVVITHDMVSAFKIASKFSMLFEGKIIYTGTPEETRTTDHPIIHQFIQGKAEGPLSNL
jgi:phospholipid/cholesterol/gamma-HCH transport system ATP-binding protein